MFRAVAYLSLTDQQCDYDGCDNCNGYDNFDYNYTYSNYIDDYYDQVKCARLACPKKLKYGNKEREAKINIEDLLKSQKRDRAVDSSVATIQLMERNLELEKLLKEEKVRIAREAEEKTRKEAEEHSHLSVNN